MARSAINLDIPELFEAGICQVRAGDLSSTNETNSNHPSKDRKDSPSHCPGPLGLPCTCYEAEANGPRLVEVTRKVVDRHNFPRGSPDRVIDRLDDLDQELFRSHERK
jgi:hypothetical protein